MGSCETDAEEEAQAVQEEVMIKYEQQQRQCEAPAIWVRQLPSQGLSYQVWPAAAALCGYLEARYGSSSSGMAGLSVLELGSGVGMVGLLAASLGARVVLTDLPDVVANLRHNVAANETAVRAGGGDATVLPLRWGVHDDVREVTSDWGVADLVLASDVVYYDHLFQPLLETLKSLLLPGRDGLLLLAHLRRWKKDSRFFKQAQKAFKVELVHTEAPAEGARRGVDIYAMREIHRRARRYRMHDFCFTIPYGIVIVCGGLLGYLRKGSMDSLAGGVGSGALLLVAGQLSLSAYHRGSNSWLAHLLQTVVSMALTWFMGRRYQSTGKIMPAGTVAGISAAMSLFYLYKLLTGGNHIPKKNPASASTGRRAD